MIDRRFGPLFVPTKNGDIITFDKNAKVKIIDDHALSYTTYKRSRGHRRVIDNVTWHFYEEINADDQPWHNKIRYHLDSKTREVRNSLQPCPTEHTGLIFITNLHEKKGSTSNEQEVS